MTQVTCMFLAIVALLAAWDPVRPGTLVRKIGDMIIVNQSVRVLLKFDNISVVRENIRHINHGIQMVKDKLVQSKISNVKQEKKLDTIQLRVNKVENNFLHSKNKRGLGIAIAIRSLVGLGVTNIGLYAELRSSVNNLQNSMSRIDDLQEETEEIQLTTDEVINSIEHLSIKNSNEKESLEIFMVLDQLPVKINELNTEMEVNSRLSYGQCWTCHIHLTFNTTTSEHHTTSKI